MLARLDRIAAVLVMLVGVLHLAVGHAAFLAPTERRTWFAAAGFLLITTGLANLAASPRAGRGPAVTALSGNLAILVIGGLIASADRALLLAPQTIVLLALGIFLSARRGRDLIRG